MTSHHKLKRHPNSGPSMRFFWTSMIMLDRIYPEDVQGKSQRQGNPTTSVSDTGQSQRLLSLYHTDSGQTAKAIVRITCVRSKVLVKVMMNLDLSMFT